MTRRRIGVVYEHGVDLRPYVRTARSLPEAQIFYLLDRGWSVLRRRSVGAVWRETQARLRWRLELRKMR